MMKKAVLAAALAVAASGAFAQAAVQSSTNVAVTSGTGVVVANTSCAPDAFNLSTI